MKAVLLWAALVWWQAATVTPNAVSPNSAALDRWIVARYRHAGLLPDTVDASPTLAAAGSPPRIERVAAGTTTDTLWAVHFVADDSLPAFAVNATVRLTGPTGTATPASARVLARRPFRAPRLPDASPSRPDAWRVGWAYLVVLPHHAARPVMRYRGWLLLAAPRPSRPARLLSHFGS